MLYCFIKPFQILLYERPFIYLDRQPKVAWLIMKYKIIVLRVS